MGKIRACGTAFGWLEQAVIAGKAGQCYGQNGFAAALGQVEHPFGLLQAARQAAHLVEYAGKLRPNGIKSVMNPSAGVDGAIGKRGNAVVAEGTVVSGSGPLAFL